MSVSAERPCAFVSGHRESVMQRRTASQRHTARTSVRAARRSEWLRGALAHHYQPDPSVDNEVVVLATGIDQYLQEVFHHLSFYNGGDLVSAGDFSLLCDVLGMSAGREGARDTDADDEEARAVRASLPRELHFKEFHERLCGYFGARARGDAAGARLPVTEETEHIEREIRLRWPRVRRRKCVSFDLSKDIASWKRPNAGSRRHGVGKVHEDAAAGSDQLGALQKLEMENASLRELVEDLRSALQGSDARCLALEVALRRERGPLPGRAARERLKESEPIAHPRTQFCSQGTRYLLKELELIRASRDGQLEEAIRFNQRLEEELSVASSHAHRLEETIAWLRRENGQIKRMAEEARAALANGLDRVKEMQGQAQLVPSLQKRLRDLETELQVFRNSCVCRGGSRSPKNCSAMWSGAPLHVEREESCIQGVEEGLQRSVEGRAASDEEEEEKGAEVGQCCLVEVKRLIKRLHNCAKGCQSTAARHLLVTQVYLHDNHPKSFSISTEVRGSSRRAHTCAEEKEKEVEKSLCSMLKDMMLRQDEVEALRQEIRVVETERVRLSLLEEKLTDALSLLLQLHSQKISQRVLGKILLDTLNISSKAGHDTPHALQVVDTLCRQLLSCELLTGKGGAQVGSSAPQDAANPLLISC